MGRTLRRIGYAFRLLQNVARQTVAPAEPVTVEAGDEGLDTVFVTPFSTVIDVGAHAGEFVREIRRLAPSARILAFEPLPGPYRALTKAMHGAPEGSVAYALALGDAEAHLEMTEYPFTPCSSLLPPAAGARKWFPYMIGGRRRSVRVRRLDDILHGGTLARPLLLKLDVQGYEDRVLAGAERTLAQADVLLVETSHVAVYEGQPLLPQIRAWLEARGFRYDGAVRRYHGFSGREVVQEDSLFTRSA